MEGRIVRSLFFLFFSAVAVFLFLRSPYFEIEEIYVKGCVATSPEDIMEIAGVRRGVNIFAVDVDKARQVLECSPMIAAVRITRRLPRTIEIELTERTPVALVQSAGKLWLVDTDGYVLAEDNGRVPGLVCITGVSRPLSAGMRLDKEEVWPLECIRAMGPLTKRLSSEVRISDEELTLVLRDGGARVFVGRADAGLRSRLQSLESVLMDLSTRNQLALVEYIELRYGTPSVMFRAPSRR